MIEQQNMNKPMLQKPEVQSLQKYKKKLLAQVVTIFLICLIIILQRVFYQVIVQGQQHMLTSLQESSGLTIKKGQQYQADGITNSFLQFYGSLSQFPIQILLVTHYLATIYCAYDALLGTKITYISMGIIYIVSTLQMLYSEPRPFWQEQNILCSRCIGSYTHPSLGIILMLFIPFYTYYCWSKNIDSEMGSKIPNKHIMCGVALAVITLVVQFFNFMIGSLYLINLAMSLVIGVLVFMIAVSGNQLIEKAIKKATIFKTQAKKYTFYWLLFICVLATFVLIVFSGEDMFMDIDWVQNYMKCTRYLHYPGKSYRYDEIIGPWFNFIQTSTLFAWIGAVFGISACFRKIPNIDWARGPMNKRIIRAVITNLFIVPSWVFILVIQDNGSWVKNIGLNTYLVNAVHFFILYIWIFGYMPFLVFHKLLKLTNKEDDDFYVIVEQPMIEK